MSMMKLLAGALMALAITGPAQAQGPSNVQDPAAQAQSARAKATNVVLVHGGTMDGSGWSDVFHILRAQGLRVTVVQLPHTSLEDDIAAARLAVSVQRGPTVLVGHSYGGAVITEAGTAPNVKALVYVAALQPDVGESLAEVSSYFPMGIDMVMLDEERFVPNPETFHEMIGADLPRDVTEFLSASSKPMPVSAFQVPFEHAAWREKPSFGIVTTQDRVLSADLLRWMYQRTGTSVTEVTSGHMVTCPTPWKRPL